MKTLRLFILALTLIVCMPVMAGLRIDNIIPDPERAVSGIFILVSNHLYPGCPR
jgi:hypothetical protein